MTEKILGYSWEELQSQQIFHDTLQARRSLGYGNEVIENVGGMNLDSATIGAAFNSILSTEYYNLNVLPEEYPLYSGSLINIDAGNYSMTSGNRPVYTLIEEFGEAKFLSLTADDFPTLDLNAQQIEMQAVSIGIAVTYDYNDYRNSNGGAIGSLLREKIERATKFVFRKHEEVLAYGSALHNVYGIFTNPYVTVQEAPATGTGSTTAWANKTNDLKLADILTAKDTIMSATNQMSRPDQLFVDYAKADILRRSNLDSTQKSIAQALEEEGITIIPYQNFKIKTGGTEYDGFALRDSRNDEAKGYIVDNLIRGETNEAFKGTVKLAGASAGVSLVYPKSMIYVRGI